MQTNDSQAAGMDTNDFLVIRPDLHESGQVGALQRIVKREFCFFGGGKYVGHRDLLLYLVGVNHGAFGEFVFGAAVGAFDRACVDNV